MTYAPTTESYLDVITNTIEVDSKKKTASRNEPQELQRIEDEPNENNVTETEVLTMTENEDIALSEKTTIELQKEKTNIVEETTQSSINEKQEQTTQANESKEIAAKKTSATQKQETKSPEKKEKTLTIASQEKSAKKSNQEIATEKSTNSDIVIIDGVKYRAQPNTKITYYCPCYQCSEGYGRGTSSGTTATAGRTVAMPTGVSFGTKIYYNGHTYTCEDRGGAITSGHIDIFCDTHSECNQHSDSGTYQTIYVEVK